MNVGNLRESAASGGFWMGWLLLVTAAMIGSPTASFGLAFLAVTAAVLPLALGTRKQRIGAVVVLILSLMLVALQVKAAQKDPYFKKGRPAQIPQTS